MAVLLRWFVGYQMRTFLIPSKTCSREFVTIPSRDPERLINAWIYYPPTSAGGGEPKPLLVNWHGSGFVLPGHGLDHLYCEKLASDAHVLVFDADYRKGPEWPFPAAVEDVEDTLKWVGSHPNRFALDCIALSGFSAGGNLALVAASEVGMKIPRLLDVRAVFAFYPLVDLSSDPQLKSVPTPIEPLAVAAQRFFVNCYVPDDEQRRDSRVSPIYADPATFLGKVVLFIFSGDVLAPEAETLGEKLRISGTDVEIVRLNNAKHGFDKGVKPNSGGFAQMEFTYSKVVSTLRQLFSL